MDTAPKYIKVKGQLYRQVSADAYHTIGKMSQNLQAVDKIIESSLVSRDDDTLTDAGVAQQVQQMAELSGTLLSLAKEVQLALHYMESRHYAPMSSPKPEPWVERTSDDAGPG